MTGLFGCCIPRSAKKNPVFRMLFTTTTPYPHTAPAQTLYDYEIPIDKNDRIINNAMLNCWKISCLLALPAGTLAGALITCLVFRKSNLLSAALGTLGVALGLIICSIELLILYGISSHFPKLTPIPNTLHSDTQFSTAERNLDTMIKCAGAFSCFLFIITLPIVWAAASSFITATYTAGIIGAVLGSLACCVGLVGLALTCSDICFTDKKNLNKKQKRESRDFRHYALSAVLCSVTALPSILGSTFYIAATIAAFFGGPQFQWSPSSVNMGTTGALCLGIPYIMLLACCSCIAGALGVLYLHNFDWLPKNKPSSFEWKTIAEEEEEKEFMEMEIEIEMEMEKVCLIPPSNPSINNTM